MRIYSVMTLIGGHHLAEGQLEAGVAAWTGQARVEAIEAPPVDGGDEIVEVQPETWRGDGAWVYLRRPWGAGAFSVARSIALTVAEAIDSPLELLVAGQQAGFDDYVLLDYVAVQVHPDGRVEEFVSESGMEALAELNEQLESERADEVPTEFYDQVLNALLEKGPTMQLEPPSVDAGPAQVGRYFRVRPSCDDPRVEAILEAVRHGAEYETESQDDGRLLVRVFHADGGRQLSFLSADQADLFCRFVE